MTRTNPPTFEGVNYRFIVKPLVTLPLSDSNDYRGKVTAWINRPHWDKRRATKWLVSVEVMARDNPCSEIRLHGSEISHPGSLTFRTQREAKAEAQRLAAEEKTIALLQGH